jgi:hypothetical protein
VAEPTLAESGVVGWVLLGDGTSQEKTVRFEQSTGCCAGLFAAGGDSTWNLYLSPADAGTG